MLGLVAGDRDNQQKMQEVFYGTEIRSRHSNNFATTFGRLIDGAKAVDTDDMVTNALLYGSAAGMLYRVIQHVNGTELMDPLTGLSGKPDNDELTAPGSAAGII